MEMTNDQNLAAESRGSSRLVSAAAGSGKTTVLVERLLRLVDEGADIDKLCVVTYTRAAAGDLRSKILKKLNERIAADPGNRHLRRQPELCSRAFIGTIDSICGRFLRENVRLAELRPDFKVVEPERAEAILRSALEKVLEETYAQADSLPGFRALADTFGGGRDDRKLEELVVRLHNTLQSHEHPRQWLAEQKSALTVSADADVGETRWGTLLLKNIQRQAAFRARRLRALTDEMEQKGNATGAASWGVSMTASAKGLEALAAAAGCGNWDAAAAAARAVEFPTPKGYKKADDRDPDRTEEIKGIRNKYKDWVRKAVEGTFDASSAELAAEMEAARPAMEALLDLTQRLMTAFENEKRRQNVVDFSDQEHMMLDLLEDKSNGLAASLSGRFLEVLVDEYQDVNRCQDRLFTLLSDNGRKLFMVGDVKQSIYRFRMADPTIFLEKYGEWADASQENKFSTAPLRIFLRENFRSSPEILDAANHVFENIMSGELGELDYDENAALRKGRDVPCGARVELALISPPETADEDGGDGAAERPDRMRAEADCVARKIRDLVDGGVRVSCESGSRPADWGDVAILLRSNRGADRIFHAALTALGIPAVTQQGSSFFESLEITMLLSYLAVIDNPRQDVPLISVLRSPLFGFRADDLAAVRTGRSGMDFWSALVLAAETQPKCAAFVDELEACRALAADLSVSSLLERICGRSDLFALLASMPDGETRRENVYRLLDYARQFEQDGYRGVFRFVAWMARLRERGEGPQTGNVEQGKAVRIISIHHSKGLEYPIVFLSGTGKSFNLQDLNRPVLLHREYGLGGRVIRNDLGISWPSLAWRAIREQLKTEALSEEMRVLYVAMTRAVNRLYITCSVADGEALRKKAEQDKISPLPPELLSEDRSMAMWLVRAAVLKEDGPIRLTLCSGEERSGEPAPAAPEAMPAAADICEAGRLEGPGWTYPWQAAVELPSKITPSSLHGRDEPDSESLEMFHEYSQPAPPRRPEPGRKSAPLTGAERGTAWHAALQFIDLAAAQTADGAAAELRRLTERGHLTPEQAACIDPAGICAFAASGIGKRILAADEARREFRFSLLVPAEDYFPVPGGDELLVQGIVDCCIREGETVTVIDYKTDAVTEETVGERAAFYAPQIRAYAAALRRIFGLPVRECVLYFPALSKEVSVPPEL